MSLITRMLRQRAVYWPPLTDPRGRELHDNWGQRRYGDPVEVRVRWEPTVANTVTADEEKEVFSATVYVGQDVEVGGLLKLGTLAALETNDPRENTGVYEIKRFVKTPNLRVSKFLRTAYL